MDKQPLPLDLRGVPPAGFYLFRSQLSRPALTLQTHAAAHPLYRLILVLCVVFATSGRFNYLLLHSVCCRSAQLFPMSAVLGELVSALLGVDGLMPLFY